MTREPVAIINAIGIIAVAILPVLAALGIVSWSVEQFGVVETFVVLIVGTITTLFARSKVSPVPVTE